MKRLPTTSRSPETHGPPDRSWGRLGITFGPDARGGQRGAGFSGPVEHRRVPCGAGGEVIVRIGLSRLPHRQLT